MSTESGAVPLPLTAGAAFVAAGPGQASWTIGSGAIAKTLAWAEGEGLHLAALTHRTTGYIWRPELTAGDHAGGEFILAWEEPLAQPVGEPAPAPILFSGRSATVLRDVHATVDQEAQTATLAFDLGLEAGGTMLDVTLHCMAFSANGVIEQWLTVSPARAGTLSRVAPLSISAGGPPEPVAHWVRGIQNHGHYMPRSGPYPAYQLRHAALDLGDALQLESGLRSTWYELPWLALDSNPGGLATNGQPGSEGFFAGLLYSGRWSAEVDAAGLAPGAPLPEGPAACVTLTLTTEGYATPLAAGVPWRSPAAFCGVYAGDLDDAAAVQHQYMRRAVMPRTGDDFPWVQYNSWFAHLVDIDETILRREADYAAQLGAEVFVIDAGWWEPSRRTSDNFTTGLGLWQPSAEKFPGGLRAFADYVRSRGMRFGIWVEPERVDLRRPGTWRDSWIVRHHDAIVSPPWPPDTVSAWLCYGHPEVQAWAVEWISRLVEGVGAEWLKWDSNWWGVCTCTNHGHSATDGEFHQAQGVHNVLQHLRARFPQLMIENCAGGGTRTDFAMLANSHATWLHDASTPSRRVRFHLAGANVLFPPELCNTFVVDADDEPLTDPATPRAELDTIARSRMLGAYGVSARLPEWTPEAFAAVQTAIAQYKQLRPSLKTGRFYHLLPQAEYACPDLPPEGQWEAYAVVAADRQEGATWVFRAPGGDESRRIWLRGLDPLAHYVLKDADTGHTVAGSGAQWMEDGIEVALRERTSALIFVATSEKSQAAGGEATP